MKMKATVHSFTRRLQIVETYPIATRHCGWMTAHPRSQRLDVAYPSGLLPDGQRKGDPLRPPHGKDIGTTKQFNDAYKRGMQKWYDVDGLVIDCVDLPPLGEELPPDWRPPWVIPQQVVLKDKDLYRSLHTGKPAKTRCVCDLRQPNAHWRAIPPTSPV